MLLSASNVLCYQWSGQNDPRRPDLTRFKRNPNLHSITVTPAATLGPSLFWCGGTFTERVGGVEALKMVGLAHHLLCVHKLHKQRPCCDLAWLMEPPTASAAHSRDTDQIRVRIWHFGKSHGMPIMSCCAPISWA